MKQLRYFLLPIWQAAVELLFYVPIWLTYVIYFVPMSYVASYAILLISAYWLVYLLCKSKQQITNRFRIGWALLIGVIPIVVVHLLANLTVTSLLIGGLIGVLFVNQSFLAVSKAWVNSFNGAFMIAFILLAVAIHVFKVLVLHDLVEYNMWYFISGICSFILFLYIHNERIITNQQMVDRQSTSIKRSIVMNRWYISVLAMLTIAISLFREVQEKIEQWIRAIIATILGWFTSEELVEEELPQESPPQMVSPFEGIGENNEPNLFWIWLERIITWLIYIVIIVAAIALIYFLIRKVLPLAYRQLLKLLGLRHQIQHEDENYTDEIEIILPQREQRSFKLLSKRKFDPLKQWDQKSFSEKIRALYLYTTTLGKQSGINIRAEHTAKENLTELMNVQGNTNIYTNLLNTYNEVKYGQVEKESEIADQLKLEIEKSMKKQ